MKQESLNLICTHIKDKLVEFKKSYSDEIVKSESQKDIDECKAAL